LSDERQKADTVVNWDSKITGRELMQRVADELRRHGRFPGRDLFKPGAALEQLREQVTRMILGQALDAESKDAESKDAESKDAESKDAESKDAESTV
jgi:hypothetical protein